jgi:Flp pilus assembly pilin Flp
MKNSIATIRSRMSRLHSDERGLTTVEYIIVLVLIAITAFVVWQNFGTSVKDTVTNSTTQVNKLRDTAANPN